MKHGQTAEAQPLAASIAQVATGLAGRVGFAAQEIGADEVIAFRGDESFAMASTYKVAISTALLDRVDRGELSLGQMVDITRDMLVVGESALAETFVHSGIQLSVANLIEVMITESDNSATDICMGAVGAEFQVQQSGPSITQGEFVGPGPGVVPVGVNETRRHHQSVGVDGLLAKDLLRSDGGDPAVLDTDIPDGIEIGLRVQNPTTVDDKRVFSSHVRSSPW